MIYSLGHFDIDAIHKKYAGAICDFVTRNTNHLKRFFPKTMEQNLTQGKSEHFTQLKTRQFKAKEEFLFVLLEKGHKVVLGLVYIKELDWKKGQGELAYCIDSEHGRRGYTTLAVQKSCEYAFNTLGLRTLQIITHHTNTASVRVAEKCGFAWKETLKKAFTPPNEEALDMELYELHHKTTI